MNTDLQSYAKYSVTLEYTNCETYLIEGIEIIGYLSTLPDYSYYFDACTNYVSIFVTIYFMYSKDAAYVKLKYEP